MPPKDRTKKAPSKPSSEPDTSEKKVEWKTPADVPQLGKDKYRSFIENLPVLFYAVEPDPPYSPIYVSPAFEMFGYPLERWLNNPDIWVNVIHEEDRDRVSRKPPIRPEQERTFSTNIALSAPTAQFAGSETAAV